MRTTTDILYDQQKIIGKQEICLMIMKDTVGCNLGDKYSKMNDELDKEYQALNEEYDRATDIFSKIGKATNPK
jgi:hypothetical protein